MKVVLVAAAVTVSVLCCQMRGAGGRGVACERRQLGGQCCGRVSWSGILVSGTRSLASTSHPVVFL